MILVEVGLSQAFGAVSSSILKSLVWCVAVGLHGNEDGAQLSVNDIEVRVREQHILDLTTDGNNPSYDFVVTIFASDFPSRKANLDYRRKEIAEALKPLISKQIRGCVRILLCPGSFGEI